MPGRQLALNPLNWSVTCFERGRNVDVSIQKYVHNSIEHSCEDSNIGKPLLFREKNGHESDKN